MMNGRNESGYAMDVLNIAAFIMGLLNYEQNLDQTGAQRLLDAALSELHEHLRRQDEKLNHVLEILEKEV